VAIVTRVNTGYFDEGDDVVGIAHVLEHMYFKGTPTRGVGDIAKETKASGGYLNAHTIYDNTTYYTVLPANGLRAGLEIQADAYANSVIDAEELARELEVIIQEAKRKSDNPSAVATETTYELLHDRHRMRRWRIGREEGLRKLTSEQLRAFYRNFYKPSNTVLAIAGDFNTVEVLRDVERLYGSLPSGTPTPDKGPDEESEATFRYRELSGDIAQTQVVMGWRTPNTFHEDTPALDFAASVLAAGRASRLYRAVRERKLASSVSAYNYTPTQLGVFALHSEGDHATSVEAARAMWAEVEKLRSKVPESGEVERVKNVFESRWLRRLETMEGKANYLAEWEGMGDWRMGAEYFNRIMGITAAEVRAAAEKYLVPEKASVLIYRPDSAPPVAAGSHDIRQMLEQECVSDIGEPELGSIAVGSGRSGTTAEQSVDQIRVFRADNGIPILVNQRRSPIVYMEIQVSGGSSKERTDIAGISNLAVRTTAKGTSRYSSDRIAALAENMGGSVGAGTGRDSSSWTLSVPTAHFEKGFALLADVVINATLSDEAIETERNAVLSNLAQLRDDMYSYPVRLATLAAFSGHPYGIPVSGTEDSVRALSGSVVRDWYANTVKKGEWVVGIAGDIDPDFAANVVAREIGVLTQGKTEILPEVRWPNTSETVYEMRDKAQTALALAFPGARRNDPDRYVAAMIATVASGLGGRFFEELRDKQSLAYTVHAFNASHPAAGMFLSYIATSPEKENAAREGLLGQFAELTQTQVTDEELERAKRYAVGTHAIGQESGAAVLSDMISAFTVGGGLGELAEYDARIRAVTSVQMLEFARRHFDPSRRVEGVIRGGVSR
jgi:zinc protease